MKIYQFTVDPGQKSVRLDQFLAHQIDKLSRTQAQGLIDHARIALNGNPQTKASYKVQPGDEITVEIPYRVEVEIEPEDIALDILFENDDVLVINKPAGLVVHPASGNWGGTLANAVMYHVRGMTDEEGSLRPGIVHRLDKDTSGVMIVTKSGQAKREVQKQFLNREVHKTYIALCVGEVSPSEGIIDSPIGRDPKERKKMTVISSGRRAQTKYKIIQHYRDKSGNFLSLVEAAPITGRTHQIRVHLAAIGHPIVGDALYGGANSDLNRQFLHAQRLEVRLPGESNAKIFEAPLAKDLANLLGKLRLVKDSLINRESSWN